MRLNRSVIMLLGLLAAAPALARANEPFFKADFSADTIGQPPAHFVLARGTSGIELSTVDDPTLGSGNALHVEMSAEGSRPVLTNFPAQTLAEEGDKLTLEFDFRITSSPIPDADRKFRVALLDSHNTPINANTSSNNNPTNDDTGYLARFDTGNDNAGTTVDIMRNDAGQILGGKLTNTGASGKGASLMLKDNNRHHVVLSLQRHADHLLLSLQIDAAPAITIEDLTPPSFHFDELVFGQSNLQLSYNVDNIQLTEHPKAAAPTTMPRQSPPITIKPKATAVPAGDLP